MAGPKVIAPQPGPQTYFCQTPAFECLYGGGRGGGKSYAVLVEWYAHSSKYGEDASGLMVRPEKTQLQGLIELAKRLYLRSGAKWNGASSTFTMKNGATLRMGHLESIDDAMTYQGESFTRLYVEEAGNYPSPDPIFRLFATLRSGAGVPCRIRLTANPGGVGHHWVRERYVTPAPGGYTPIREEYTNPFTGVVTARDRVYIPALIGDNAYLPEDYVANLHMSGGPKLVKAWLEGDWSVVEGAFFDNFSERKHIVKPFPLSPYWTRYMSADWGTAEPFCFLWICVAGETMTVDGIAGHRVVIPAGSLIVYREYYGMQKGRYNVGVKMNPQQVSDEIHRLEQYEPRNERGRPAIAFRVMDPGAWANVTGDGAVRDMFWREGGLDFAKAENIRANRDAKMGGWTELRYRLDGVGDGRPKLFFFESCTNLLRTLPLLQHDRAKPEDVDSESEDHAADALRYACMARATLKHDPSFPAGLVQTPQGLVPAGPNLADGERWINLEQVFRDNEPGGRAYAKEQRRLKLTGGSYIQ